MTSLTLAPSTGAGIYGHQEGTGLSSPARPSGDRSALSTSAVVAQRALAAAQPPEDTRPIERPVSADLPVANSEERKWLVLLCVLLIIVTIIFVFLAPTWVFIPALILLLVGWKTIQKFRNPEIAFSEFAKNRTGANLHDRDIILILSAKPKFDHNGTFAEENYSQLAPLHDQDDYDVVCLEIESAKDIPNAVKQMKLNANRIHGLMIRCHGDQHGLQLASPQGLYENVVTTDMIEPHLREALPHLEAGAGIVLIACDTGKTNSAERSLHGDTCMADAFARLAPGCTVTAPARSTDSHRYSLKIRSKAERERRRNEGYTDTSPFDARFNYYILNATATFHYPKV